MRRIRYQVACSLDGFIAGPNGEIDWIVTDPEIDFGEIFAQFDTLLIGRRTYEELPEDGAFEGMEMIVCSTTLRPEDHSHVTIFPGDLPRRIDALRRRPGKDIWLFGGGELFRSLLEMGRVDTVEPAIIPVLLGEGRPLLPPSASRAPLRLTGHRTYPSGIVLLEYAVGAPGRTTRGR